MTMGNRFVTPATMLPLGPQYSQMGLATGMQMGVPQLLPAPVLGAGLPLVNTSADVLSVLNHPVGPVLMPIQNSALFTPTENYLPQSVPPACAAFPNQIPNSTISSNLLICRFVILQVRSENTRAISRWTIQIQSSTTRSEQLTMKGSAQVSPI